MLRQIALTAALLSLFPVAAQEGLRDPNDDREDRKENRIAPKSADRAARPLVMRRATDLKLGAFDERVAPCKGGFVVREGKEFVKYDAPTVGRTVLFTARGDVAEWWANRAGAVFAYKADGKLFLHDGKSERELPGEMTAGVTFSADGSWVAWCTAKTVRLLNLANEKAEFREIGAGEGRQMNGVLAISADGKLYSVIGGDRVDVIGVLALEGDEKAFTPVYTSSGMVQHLRAAASAKAILFVETSEGNPAKQRVKRMEPDGTNPVEMFVHDRLGGLHLDNEGASFWISAPGANGRWQVWRSNVRGIGTMKELDQESIASDADGNCLEALPEPCSTAYYVVVKNPDGALRLVRWTQE